MFVEVINKSGTPGGVFVGKIRSHWLVDTRTKGQQALTLQFVDTNGRGHTRHVTLDEAELYAIIEAAWEHKLLQNVSIQD